MKLSIISEENQSFLKTVRDFDVDLITLTNYLDYLIKKSNSNYIRHEKYENISICYRAIQLEAETDFSKIDHERLDMMDELESKAERSVYDEISARSLDYRMQKISPSAYYNFFISKGKEYSLEHR